MRPRFLCLLAAAATLASFSSTAGRQWWAHVEFLASDAMEGRAAGSPAHQRAAEYVAGQFRSAGLKPGSGNSFLQPVNLLSRTILEAESHIVLVRNGKRETLALGKEIMFSTRVDLAPQVTAPAVFAGHGLRISDAGHDDLAGLDLKGKVVVYLSGAPKHISGPLQAHFSSAGERSRALHQAGAVGVLPISNPKNADIPWPRSLLTRLQPSMSLADPALDHSQLLRFSASFDPSRAEKLFEGSGHSFKELLAIADSGKPLPRFPLPFSIEARAKLDRGKLLSKNVAGLLTGSDPKLRREVVVLSAHLDHIGRGGEINGDGIYNGAMDNASGIATLIEVARAFKHLRPRRSIAFVAVTAEERGLLGSRYFAAHPALPPGSSMVANINFDMFLPLHPMKSVLALGMEESTLKHHLETVTQKLKLKMQRDDEPQRNRFIRSDQYSFILRGVPALALKVGYDPGSAEEKLHKDWVRTRYHAPSDDLNQPVDLEAAAAFNRVIQELALEIANAPQTPRWNDTSFFRRFAR